MAGYDAFGTAWQVQFPDATLDYETVANVTNISVLDIEAETIDTSAHDSSGQWRTFVAGMKDAGELSMEINYDPALHAEIFSLVGGAATAMKIILTDSGAASVEFDGIVTGFSAEAPFDDKLAGTVTVKVTGEVTITP
jgi:predicted secreted protein